MAEDKSRQTGWPGFHEAAGQAEALGNAAAVIMKERRRLADCRADAARAWNSDSAARFTGKMSAAAEELEKIVAQLRETAEAIREHAKKNYKEDM